MLYHVEATLNLDGKTLWSGTWEATCARKALADAILAPECRGGFRPAHVWTRNEAIQSNIHHTFQARRIYAAR